jgi:hypothetical protein
MVTNRRSKITRLSFKKKRNNTRRKLKHRRYDKTPKTKRTIYSGGALSLLKMGTIKEISYDVGNDSISSVEMKKDAYTIELSKGVLSTTFGGNYSLKISIDLNKYRYSTLELVKHVFVEIFQIQLNVDDKQDDRVLKIPEELKRLFELEELVDYDKVIESFNKFNSKTMMCVNTRQAAIDAGLLRKTDKGELVPGNKTEVIFEFKFKDGKLVFDSVKYSVMGEELKQCQVIYKREIEQGADNLPVYHTKSKKSLNISISTTMTIEELQQKLSPDYTFPEFIVLHASYIVTTTYYGFDVVKKRENVKHALATWEKEQENTVNH